MLRERHQKQISARLNRIRGQVEGIKKMINEPRYCVDILNQVAAVRAALQGVGRMVLEDHLKTCVTRAIKRNGG
ncbi:MAG: metal-sensitive transcriptional regulator, partial [Candidatus Margulisbacteria bacterium]|nr:metal-sensitive transcriptional regulator [Candidatus Margulisiibacteriota bacterium]